MKSCRPNRIEIIENSILRYEEELMDLNPQDPDFKYLQEEIIRLREVRDQIKKQQSNGQ